MVMGQNVDIWNPNLEYIEKSDLEYIGRSDYLVLEINSVKRVLRRLD